MIWPWKKSGGAAIGYNPVVASPYFQVYGYPFTNVTSEVQVLANDPTRVALEIWYGQPIAPHTALIADGMMHRQGVFQELGNTIPYKCVWCEMATRVTLDWWAKSSGFAVNLTVVEVRYASTNGRLQQVSNQNNPIKWTGNQSNSRLKA